ncbi:MAG: NUDIX domain-containing protein, partial [Planctomycetota bacterium]
MKRTAKTSPPRKFCYEYPRPAVAVDLVVTRWVKSKSGEKRRELLLIQRKHDPFAGCWALPGGFLDEQETLEQAAARELMEETHVVARKLIPLGAFSKVDRDPRGRVVSFSYATEVPATTCQQAGDDAAAAKWFPVKRLPKLAFDHAEVIAAARK